MLNLKLNIFAINDLNDIYRYIAEDNEKYAAKTVDEIFKRIENIVSFPGIDLDLSKKVKFKTDFKYIIYKNYIIVFKEIDNTIEIYRVLSTYRDILKLFL